MQLPPFLTLILIAVGADHARAISLPGHPGSVECVGPNPCNGEHQGFNNQEMTIREGQASPEADVDLGTPRRQDQIVIGNRDRLAKRSSDGGQRPKSKKSTQQGPSGGIEKFQSPGVRFRSIWNPGLDYDFPAVMNEVLEAQAEQAAKQRRERAAKDQASSQRGVSMPP